MNLKKSNFFCRFIFVVYKFKQCICSNQVYPAQVRLRIYCLRAFYRLDNDEYLLYQASCGLCVNNLNNAVKDTEAANMSVEDIFKSMSKFSTAIRNNAGGHYNHTLFWSILTPEKNTQPLERLAKAIQEQLYSLDSFEN